MKDRHGNDPDRGIIGADLVPPPVTTPPPPPPVVKKIGYVMPVNVIGTDDQGRTLIQCPARGCGDTAHIAEDGRLVCPSGDAITEYLRAIIDREVDGCFDI